MPQDDAEPRTEPAASDPDGIVFDPHTHRQVGMLIGDEPRVTWMVANADETAMCISMDSKREAEDWLADTLRRFPDGWVAKEGYHVAPLEIWPNYSSGHDASMRFVTFALRRLGPCAVSPCSDGGFRVDGAGRVAVGRSFGEALLRLLALTDGGLTPSPGRAHTASA